MSALYPEIEPFASYRVPVESPHYLYVEEVGNPAGTPVVFLHGGPGSGARERHRRFFDPRQFRVILYDQRGCHRSTPAGETRGNTTQRLIADLESIRLHLGIRQWALFGGSWGATLALLYAEEFPWRVNGLILRGTFLARQRDLDWCFRNGASCLYPQQWSEFAGAVPVSEHGDLVQAYHRRVHSGDPAVAARFARLWSAWTGLLATGQFVTAGDVDVARVSIETHFAVNRYFIERDQILRNAHRLPPVPVSVVHGCRDRTCPVDGARELAEMIPGCHLDVLPNAGHLAEEPAISAALVSALGRLATALS